MTIEEALEVFKKSIECILTDGLKCLNTECPKCALNVTDEQYNKAARVAIEVLEKQIPKRPEEKMCLQAAELYVGKCPNCESGMNSKMNYCDNCGQKIDWSEGK